MAARPSVFLSSTFRDTFGASQRAIPLRTRILESAPTAPVDIWAYELTWPDATEPLDADTIIDRCFAGIRRCDLFVFILTGRHGSGTSLVEDDQTTSSYLELELFAAAALNKPIVVLHYRDRDPEPALLDTMLLLRRAFRSELYFIDSEQGLFDRWNEIIVALTAGRTIKSTHPGLLAEGLSHARTRRRLGSDLAAPALSFLGGELRANRKSDPDLGRAELLLNQVATSVRGEQAMPHGVALFRLWSAMRELMDKSDASLNDPAAAQLWDRAFGLWASKASWFGLHGHLWMGPLAALNSQVSLRGRHRDNAVFSGDRDVREPFGAKASAIYSIAQRMRTRERKFFHYRQAVTLATTAIQADANARQGTLSIRAHSLMRMGRLGHGWKLWEAKEDFETALRLRERSGASEASIGEIMADLGFCQILTGRPRRGLDLLQDGIRGLRSDTSANGQAFLARGLKKLELGAKLAGRATLAREARDERLRLAGDIEALDQARPGDV